MLHVIDRNTVFPIELHPRALGKNIESVADKRAAHLREVEGALHLVLLELILPPSADAPHVAYGKEAEGLEAFLFRVDHATMVIARIAFGKLAGHLRKRLGAGYADAHGHAQAVQDRLVEVLTPGLEIHVLHPIEHTEPLVDGVTVKLGAVGPDDVHQPAGHVRIKLIVGRKGEDLLTGKELRQLKIRSTLFDAELLGFIAPRHDAAIVIGQDDNHSPVQIRSERAFATDIAVVYIHECPISSFHLCLFMPVLDGVLHYAPQRELVSSRDLDVRIPLVGGDKLHIALLLM